MKYTVLIRYPDIVVNAMYDGGLLDEPTRHQHYLANALIAHNAQDAIRLAQLEAMAAQSPKHRRGTSLTDWLPILVLEGHHRQVFIR